ncbi:tellurite resistance TerB family protein [Thauera sinica]|uniref:TerB family tellurite resistance protein n=1 Tax=Thauera sinica TaxID=2665146 RepID=A0ABW1AYY9_9RHOO|nr:TerB family tellurite resistance protein [Thauera sp. K11]ATE58628.1 hypothetical protein CCZ27_00410 [Thauera sp. K11]
MLTRLIALLRGDIEAEASESGPFERRQIAVAVLLLEAMYVDHRASENEHAAVTRLLREHFGLPDALALELVRVAGERYAEVLDDWEFTEAVRVGFDAGARRQILTMLWEVAYADGDLARLESRLLARLAGQLELDAAAIEAARAAAAARSGLIGNGG